jgi:hypothetical protein
VEANIEWTYAKQSVIVYLASAQMKTADKDG